MQTVSKATVLICQQLFDTICLFASASQRKKAFDAFIDYDLPTLRSLERELDLI